VLVYSNSYMILICTTMRVTEIRVTHKLICAHWWWYIYIYIMFPLTTTIRWWIWLSGRAEYSPMIPSSMPFGERVRIIKRKSPRSCNYIRYRGSRWFVPFNILYHRISKYSARANNTLIITIYDYCKVSNDVFDV